MHSSGCPQTLFSCLHSLKAGLIAMCHIWLSLLSLKFKNKMQTGKCCLKDYGSFFTVFMCLKMRIGHLSGASLNIKETQGKMESSFAHLPL